MQTVGITIGLGNNIFQWAFGQSLKARGHEVQYQFLNSGNMHTGPNSNESHSLSPYGIVLPTGLETPQRTFHERTFAYDPGVYDQPDGTLLIGNWQSEKYFAGIENQLRSELRFSVPERVQAVAERLRRVESCFIHVRRGDYTTPTNINYHGDAGGMDYYRKAIEYIRYRLGNVTFFVFSDDPSWCKQNFPDFECISGQGFSKYDELFLMGQCKSGIIANSSFSWWAVYLGPVRNGIIVAPKRWFNNAGLDCKDLIPAGWIQL